MKHKHHHPPQHRVGKHNNTVLVTVEEHAELHLAEYLEHGLYEDWIAFHAIAGQIDKAEIQYHKSVLGGLKTPRRSSEVLRAEAIKVNADPEMRRRKREKLLGGHIHGGSRSEEDKQKISEGVKKAMDALRASGKKLGRPKGSKDKNPRRKK